MTLPCTSGSFEPTAGTHLYLLNDEAVVFSEKTQTIHAFNTAATFIWCSLELGMDVDEVAAQLTCRGAVSAASAREQVLGSIEAWRKSGLLVGGSQIMDVLEPKAVMNPHRMLGCPSRHIARTHHYRLLDTKFAVRLSSDEQEAWVNPVIAHLADTTDTAPHITLDVVAEDGHLSIYRDHHLAHICAHINELAPIVKGLIWQSAVNRYNYFLNIHAAVVCDGEEVTLLPGPPGSGKSILSVVLSSAGFDFFSDEVALLEEPDMTVRPMRLGICVKSTGWDLVAPHFPALRMQCVHYRSDGKIVRYLPPPAFTHGSNPNRSYPVRRIIFPTYNPAGPTRLLGISAAAAFSRFMTECMTVPLPLTFSRVTRLLDWFARLECYQLSMSSLEDAICEIRNVRTSKTL